MITEAIILAAVVDTVAEVASHNEINAIESWTKLIMGSLGALAAVIVGIKWLLADRNKIAAAASEERSRRIQALEDSSKLCQSDRTMLHSEMNKLQDEVRGLYRAIIEGKFGDMNFRTGVSADHLIQNK